MKHKYRLSGLNGYPVIQKEEIKYCEFQERLVCGDFKKK